VLCAVQCGILGRRFCLCSAEKNCKAVCDFVRGSFKFLRGVCVCVIVFCAVHSGNVERRVCFVQCI